MPKNVRLNGKDNFGDLIIHCLLISIVVHRKEWCEKEMLDLVLNEQNSLAKGRGNLTVLHFACLTNKLELVKYVLRMGGFNEEQDENGCLPSDRPIDQKNKTIFK